MYIVCLISVLLIDTSRVSNNNKVPQKYKIDYFNCSISNRVVLKEKCGLEFKLLIKNNIENYI